MPEIDEVQKCGDGDAPVSYNAGDRIVLRGLKKSPHLNGRHGFIAGPLTNDRYPVDLDLIVPKASKPRLNVRPLNLTKEAPLPPDADSYRAGVSNGVIAESFGRPLSFVLDQIKFLVGYVLHDDPEIRQMGDIDRLKDEDADAKLNHLMAVGWSHFDDIGSFASETDAKSVRECLVDWLKNQLPAGSGGLEAMGREYAGAPYMKIYDSLEDKRAVGGWSARIHADFWVLGTDPDGTLLIPDCNRNAVYKALGMTSNLYQMVSRSYGSRPSKWRLTLVPWYGRLVFDGVVSPIDMTGQPGPPQVASQTLQEKLFRSLEKARAEGRVVERLAQLEVPDGSVEGIDAQGLRASAPEVPDEQQPAPTEEERSLVTQLGRLSEVQEPFKRWTFRRLGYTERENKNHMGVVIFPSDPDHRLNGMPFACSALEPSSVDILKPMVKMARYLDGRPRLVAIDDKACFNRVQFLLKDLEGTSCYFYLPPSKEELDAIHLAESMNVDVFH